MEFIILEKKMAKHSSILAWKIPWTEEPHGLQSMRSQRVRHWMTNTAVIYVIWRKKAWNKWETDYNQRYKRRKHYKIAKKKGLNKGLFSS